ncbi:MAG: magnesium transporter [Verrucomicrobia bacterium]|nr:magnesium transporter [Verrucomicrobiota bacterium]
MTNAWSKAQRLILVRMLVDHTHDVLRVLDRSKDSEVGEFLAQLDPPLAAKLFTSLRPDQAAACLPHIPQSSAAAMLAACEAAIVSARLVLLDESERQRHLAQLPPEAAKEIAELMAYPPNTAGALMDPRVTTFRPDTAVRDVTARLKSIRQKRIYTLIVVDTDGQLVGAVPLQDVILAEPRQTLGELIHGASPSVQALSPREVVVETLAQHPVTTLPVVDIQGRLMGVIRHGALVQAIQSEALAGVQTMVGVSKEERALSTPWFSVQQRLPWLNINLLTAFLAASVVGLFENTISRITALAVLLPVVAGQSGNTGAQALAVTMRGLALREIRIRQWPRMIAKEAAAGCINGCAIGFVTAIGVLIWSRSVVLCLVMGVSMIISMVIAGVAGAVVPILLTAAGKDPAQSSSIILTTVTDVMGFLSFLGLATIFANLI